MFDPMTVAHEIKYPWWQYKPWPKGKKNWSDLTPAQQKGRSNHWREGYRNTFIVIWHVDPCKGPGGDDTCGWFKRAHHGDKEVLERIVKRFESDFDRTFRADGSGNTYFCGLFCPNGDPHLSVHGIVLNLFFLAAGEYFESTGHTNWKKARRWMQDNLFDILIFAENPTDSLFDGITRKFEIGCSEPYTKRKRDERIRNLAATIYGWILRSEQKWLKHPRWHIHHWQIQCNPWERIKRWLTKRCKECGSRIGMKDNGVVADGFSDNAPLTCGKCSAKCCGVAESETKQP